MGALSSVAEGAISPDAPPYVWLSNAFVNTGLEQVTLTCTGATVPSFTVDPAAQPSVCAGGGTASAPVPSSNYFVSDFKFPQTFRISLGADHRLPGGFVSTMDLLYSKNVNQLYVAGRQSRRPRAEQRRSFHVRHHRHQRGPAPLQRRLRGSLPPAARTRSARRSFTPIRRSAAPTRGRSSCRRALPAASKPMPGIPTRTLRTPSPSPAVRRSPTFRSARWMVRSRVAT